MISLSNSHCLGESGFDTIGIASENVAASGDGMKSPPVRANRLSNSLRRLKKKISSPSLSLKKSNRRDASNQATLEDECHEEQVFELKETLKKAKDLIVTLRDESLNA